MSKYYIQINKDGRPLEGGVVSKTKPKYGLYQTIDSWCCNTFSATVNNNGSIYVAPEVFNGNTVFVSLGYRKSDDTDDTWLYMYYYISGRTTFTQSEIIRILNDRFSSFGHWEKDETLGVKLVETPYSKISYLNTGSYFD